MTESSTALSLTALIQRPEELEAAWLERIEEARPLEPLLELLQTLAANGNPGQADTFGGMLMESLAGSGRDRELFQVCRVLVEACGPTLSPSPDFCARAVKAKFGTEPWFEGLARKLGFDGEKLDWQGFQTLLSWRSFLPGHVLMHRSGWGEGLVTSYDPDTEELDISFSSGIDRRIPWRTALETMKPLPDWDVRAMRLTDPERLAELVKKEPLTILRRALTSLRGKATSTVLKEFLVDKVVPAKSWNTFWKHAKKAAIEDPRIAVEGSKARPMLTLRKKALTLAEEARQALRHQKDAIAAIRGFRTWLERATREEDRRALGSLVFELLAPRVEKVGSQVERLAILLFLEELDLLEEDPIPGILAGLFGGESVESFEVLGVIEDPRLLRNAVARLPEALGEDWAEKVTEGLRDFPREALDSAVALLESSGRKDLLVRAFEEAAPFPRKHAALLHELLRVWAEGGMTGAPRLPDKEVVCRVALHCLRAVCEEKAGPERSRLMGRMQTLLLGRKGILPELLDSVDRSTIATARRIGLRAGDQYPPKVQELVEKVGRKRFPDLFDETSPMAFWEDDSRIWTTAEGLSAIREEFRILKEEKIPENSKAIGQAASLGDLSENAEWEAAMEEQRNLTDKASQLEALIKKARILSPELVPSGMAAPGTLIGILDLDTGERRSVRLLGPWDEVHGEDVVSYLAPYGAALCGAKVGEEVTVTLPSGSKHLRIESIEVL